MIPQYPSRRFEEDHGITIYAGDGSVYTLRDSILYGPDGETVISSRCNTISEAIEIVVKRHN